MATVGKYILPDELYYDRSEHLWVRPEGNGLLIGLDAVALDALGEIVHMELVPVGTTVRRGDPLGSVEAEKMVRPLLTPASGTVIAHNAVVVRNPLQITADPYGEGWVVRLAPARWPDEADALVHGSAVTAWIEREMAAYEAERRLR